MRFFVSFWDYVDNLYRHTNPYLTYGIGRKIDTFISFIDELLYTYYILSFQAYSELWRLFILQTDYVTRKRFTRN